MKHRRKQRAERGIAAGLRLAEVVLLVLLQIFLVVAGAVFIQRYAAALFTLLQIIAAIVALRIFNRKGHYTYRMGWMMLILAMPAVGLPLYWSWSGYTHKRSLGLTLLPLPKESEPAQERSKRCVDALRLSSPAWGRTAQYLQKQGFPVYKKTRMRYLSEGQLYLESLLADLARAERFIFLEYFIVAEGAILERLYRVLADRVAHGVEVKLIFDDFGNIMRFDAKTLERFRQAGIEIRIFNPVHEYINRLYVNYRDHRKIACIDGELAYTGGVNLADEYANLVERFGYWKDCGIRLEGEGAWGLTVQFVHMWMMLGGSLDNELDYYRAPQGSYTGDGYCQSFADGPHNAPDSLAEDTILQMIHTARYCLYITSPYFVVDEIVLHAIETAARSGVDVRLMLPGKPDHKMVSLAAEATFGELLSHGVKVYLYTPGFVHSKSILVDREAALLGTINMDFRSFQLHYECGVLLYGSSVIEDVLEDMYGIMERSQCLTLAQWQKRPLHRKIGGSIMRVFAFWM